MAAVECIEVVVLSDSSCALAACGCCIDQRWGKLIGRSVHDFGGQKSMGRRNLRVHSWTRSKSRKDEMWIPARRALPVPHPLSLSRVLLFLFFYFFSKIRIQTPADDLLLYVLPYLALFFHLFYYFIYSTCQLLLAFSINIYGQRG